MWEKEEGGLSLVEWKVYHPMIRVHVVLVCIVLCLYSVHCSYSSTTQCGIRWLKNATCVYSLVADNSNQGLVSSQIYILLYCVYMYITVIALLLVHTPPHPQINFFQDHTKIIICPLMSAVSYISEDKSFRNFRLPLIERHGCSKELYSRLRYAKTMTERLIAKMDSQSSKMSTEHQPTPIPTPTSMA